MFFGRGAGDKQVVQVGIGEGEAAQYLVDKRWKVWAALRRPNGMRRNSKRPNGVVMAVFGTSEGSTGI